VDRLGVDTLGEDMLSNDRRAVKDRLGGSKVTIDHCLLLVVTCKMQGLFVLLQERGGKVRDVREENGLKRGDTGEGRASRDTGEVGGKLGTVPADLQAWALKATVATNSPANR